MIETQRLRIISATGTIVFLAAFVLLSRGVRFPVPPWVALCALTPLMYLPYMLLVKRGMSMRPLAFLLVAAGILGAASNVFRSADIRLYIAGGRIQSEYGVDVYGTTIAEVASQHPGDELLQNVPWAGQTSFYGFTWTLLTRLLPADVDFYKAVYLAIHLGCLLLVYLVAKKLNAPTDRAWILYGLSPLVMLDFLGDLHNDAFVLFFLLLGLFLYLEKRTQALAIVPMILSCFVKFIGVPLLLVISLPLLFEMSLKKRTIAVFLGLVTTVLLVVLNGGPGVIPAIGESYGSSHVSSSIYSLLPEGTHSILTGSAFLVATTVFTYRSFRSRKDIGAVFLNGGLFYLVILLLGVKYLQPWYAITLIGMAAVLSQRESLTWSAVWLCFGMSVANTVFFIPGSHRWLILDRLVVLLSFLPLAAYVSYLLLRRHFQFARKS